VAAQAVKKIAEERNELLEALRSISDHPADFTSPEVFYHYVKDVARDVLAKAEGGHS